MEKREVVLVTRDREDSTRQRSAVVGGREAKRGRLRREQHIRWRNVSRCVDVLRSSASDFTITSARRKDDEEGGRQHDTQSQQRRRRRRSASPWNTHLLPEVFHANQEDRASPWNAHVLLGVPRANLGVRATARTLGRRVGGRFSRALLLRSATAVPPFPPPIPPVFTCRSWPAFTSHGVFIAKKRIARK